MESLADLPLDTFDDEDDKDDRDNEDADSDIVEVTHDDGESVNMDEKDDDKKTKTPVWKKPQKKKGCKKASVGGKQKSKSKRKDAAKPSADGVVSTSDSTSAQNANQVSQV